MAWRKDLVAAGLLLVFGICSILVVSQILDTNSIQHVATFGMLDQHEDDDVATLLRRKPPLDPPPERLLDLPGFRYIANADPCVNDSVTGVVLVTSHADHVEVRSAARRAYPAPELRRLGLRRVFLLARSVRGSAQGDWTQRALENEAKRFGDLVQGDFQEAYRNLTYKHTMGLRWAYRYCPQARFVIKMDDDIVVDFYQLTDVLGQQTAAEVENSLQGYVLRGLHPSREPANKWFVTRAEYPGDTYPDFLSGWLYVTTPAVARVLVAGAHRRSYFWIDDLVLTGLVRAQLDPASAPRLRNLSALFTVHPEVLNCCIAEPELRCDVAVGPNGGDSDLIVRFQEVSARCHYGAAQSCRAREPGRGAERTCVVRGRHGPPLQAGRGLAKPVRMF